MIADAVFQNKLYCNEHSKY